MLCRQSTLSLLAQRKGVSSSRLVASINHAGAPAALAPRARWAQCACKRDLGETESRAACSERDGSGPSVAPAPAQAHAKLPGVVSRTAIGLGSGLAAWLAATGSALASEPSAYHTTTLLDWMLLGLLCYWSAKVISYYLRGQDEKEHQQERQKQQQQQSKRPQQGGSSSRPSINSRQEQGIQPTHTFSHQASPHHNHENEKDEGDKDVEKWKKEEEEGGLTGMTHAHVRSYVHMTKDSAANPDVIELRNRAMATAAVYSVKVAVKECAPRIHQLLRDLTAPGKALARPKTANSDPVAQMVYDALVGLGRPWAELSEADHRALERQLVQAVAERAAMEQIEAMVRVCQEAHAQHLAGLGKSMAGTGSGPGSASIRGGGAH